MLPRSRHPASRHKTPKERAWEKAHAWSRIEGHNDFSQGSPGAKRRGELMGAFLRMAALKEQMKMEEAIIGRKTLPYTPPRP